MHTVQNPFSDESDACLLYLIGEAGSSEADQDLANKAFREFHQRHFGFVCAVLDRYARQLETVEIDTGLLCNQVFEKAYRKAHSFSDKSNNDKEACRKLVRAWLGRVASNLARDALRSLARSHPGITIVPLAADHDIVINVDETRDDETPTPRKELKKLQELLQQMKPEERDILLTYANFAECKAGGRELPSSERDALEQRTGYERSTIRQKYRRLILRLQTELAPASSTTSHVLTHV
ncbi:RNA polymerase sigma factor [Prosthecobacter sp.]|uniref:RNA polymerase sigma factor n=1 Tax=Prosthecobacter sp. TaxID=1965333 RepID=UPI00378460F1